MNQVITQSKTLPPAGEILKEAWGIYRANFKKFVSLAVIPFSLLVISTLFLPALGEFLDPELPVEFAGPPPNIVFYSFLVSLSSLFLSLIAIFFQLSYVISAIFLAKERQNPIEEFAALKYSLRKVAPYVWIGFLVGLAVLGGLILFVIPGIIFSIWFSLSVYILVAEDKRGKEALRRSKELVKGNWRKVFWRFLVAGFFIGLVSFPFSLLARIAEKAGFFYAEIVLGGLTLAISVLTAGFWGVYGYLLYEKLKSIKENSI